MKPARGAYADLRCAISYASQINVMVVASELSVIEGGVRSASVVALKPITGIVIGRTALIAFMQRSPELLDVLLRPMGALIRRLTDRATDLVFLDLAARVAKPLLREAEERGGEERQGVLIDLGLTQTELAQMSALPGLR